MGLTTKIITDTQKLSQVCESIEKIDDGIRQTVDKMEKIMISVRGIGLSAPQIGLFKRLFVFLDGSAAGLAAVINPEILSKYNQMFMMPEGCLSLPKEKIFSVGRSKKIKVRHVRSF